MFIAEIFFLTILLIYAFLICRYLKAWTENREYRHSTLQSYPCFSVIIPFRNEQASLPLILNDLLLQDYPPGCMEIVLVDDHSTDRSVELAGNICPELQKAKLIKLPEGKTGKKEALLAGIENAMYELIVTTDADCRVGRQWLSTLASYYNEFNPVMIIGPVIPDFRKNGFFHYFQQLEMISLIGSGAASALLGKPIYCSGANLCYAKEKVYELDDPLARSIASGDDTLLLLQLKKDYGSRIRFLKSLSAMAVTKTEENIYGFLIQRSRWVSKSKHYRDYEIILPALLVLFTNMALIVSLFLMLSGKVIWLFPVLFAIKLVTDGLFLNYLLKFFRIKFRLVFYFFSSLLYPFYLITILCINIFLPYNWKGRKVNR